MAGDYQFSATLNDQQILAALKNIDANIEKIAKTGNDAFKGIGDSSKSGAASMGVLAGATTAVVTKLLEMGQAAVRGFAEVIKGAVNSAKVLETATTSVGGILGGDPALALAAMDKIREESIRLGIDLTELAPAFLPKVEDLDQFAKIGELVSSLATLDPAQGAAGARIAINEALAGDLVSLRRRFEIDIAPIREAQAEFGELEGLLVGLEEVLKSRGQDFDTLSKTATVAMNQTRQIGEDVKTTFGEPILEALKEDFQALNDFLLENKDTIDIVAGSLGDLVAKIAGFTGDQIVEFIQGIDIEKVKSFVLFLQNTFDLIALITQSNKDFRTSIDGNNDSIEDFNNTLSDLTELLRQIATLNAKIQGLQTSLLILQNAPTIIKQLTDEGVALGDALDFVAKSAQEAYTQRVEETDKVLDAHTETIKENEQALQDLIDAQNKSNDTSGVDKYLEEQAALDAEAEAAKEATDAMEKYNDAREEYEIDKERAAADLALKQQRALLDAEIEFAQKREDIARKNATAIEDIYRDNQQKIIDARTDLRRDEEDIARKGARSQIEIEREAANRRVEIETDYRRELQRIRERFDFDAQEAIRQNDAIAFLRIQRQKDFELSQAQTQRDEEIQDAEASAIEQRQKLQEQLQFQIEDARIANQRKLEDLRLSLERELQEQRIKYAREVQEAKIAEDRKRQELARTFQRQQQDFQTYWDRKLQDLIRNYQREIQIIQQYEAQKARIMAESRARARAAAEAASADSVLLQNYGNQYTPNPNAQQEANSADSVLLQNYSGRKYGGRAVRGVPYLVGENGPELMVPDRGGTVYPNYRLKFNPGVGRAVTNINNNTRQTNFNVDALMSMLSPQQIAIVQQLVNQLGMSIYQ